VVGEDAEVIDAVPGLPACAVHVPLPVADIVALPPGNEETQFTFLSGPAFGLDVTVTLAVSVHPLAFVQMKLYIPDALKFEIKVVDDEGLAIVAGPGLPACVVQVPLPVADIVALPPGNEATQSTFLSGPALGLDVTVTLAVSVHPLALVQMKLYIPDALKFEITVVEDEGLAMVASPGLPACAVQLPEPVADIVVLPPGNEVTQSTFLSGPALGFAVTNTLAVSVQLLAFVHMKL
jgi:hypothetical protein